MAQDPIVDGKGNYVIDDGTGAQVRTRINTTLQAIATNNSGSEAPPANNHQWFANTNTNKLCYKDASTGNNATTNYFNLANLDGGLSVDQTSTFNGDVIFQGTNGTTNITFDASIVNGSGGLKFKDFATIRLGTDDDFIISHFQGFNILTSTTDKPTAMVTRTFGSGQACYTLQTQDSSGTDLAYEAFVNGRQELYFNGSSKFQTSADGIEVIGSILPTTDNDKPLGSSSKRFSTLHSGALNTGDINMSNLNDNGNEIDGSKGSWSIQEGSDDLFLINRVSGKKYKFNLTEIT
tara:strand:+ start:428 stop:1306 length:879 start_codon:yes stop_codon:yes gene_type:complete